MERVAQSHKGENGTVAIVGGSKTMHGAPLFSALAAEASGADLIYVAVPAIHQEVARVHSLNLQVHPFQGDDITTADLKPLLELLATMDAAVIGPGLSRTEKAQTIIRELIESAPCPLVLDASALQPWTLKAIHRKAAVLTPHLGELERMGLAFDDISSAAHEHGVTIHVKGSVDHIAHHDGSVRTVEGGNPGLTVGGTGDALAGLIAGFLAQKLEAVDACEKASRAIKGAGDALFKEFGYAYGTQRVIGRIPEIVKSL